MILKKQLCQGIILQDNIQENKSALDKQYIIEDSSKYSYVPNSSIDASSFNASSGESESKYENFVVEVQSFERDERSQHGCSSFSSFKSQIIEMR